MEHQKDSVPEQIATVEDLKQPASPTVGVVSASSSTSGFSHVAVTNGYSKKIIVGVLEDKFQCGHCNNVLKNPLQSLCGHRFCSGCRDELSRRNVGAHCKECAAEGVPHEETVLELDKMFEDKAAIREMRRIPTRCINKSCTWEGLFQDYVAHDEACDKKLVPCSLCGTAVSKARLSKHETKDCKKRIVQCPQCKDMMPFEEQSKHKDRCPNAPVLCQKCAYPVLRNELEEHKLTVCAGREIQCPVPACNIKLPLKDYQSHFNKTSESLQIHMQYVIEKLSLLEENVDALSSLDSHGAAGGVGYSPEVHPVQQESQETGTSSGAECAVTEVTEEKLKLHEDLMSVLHGEIMRIIHQIEALTKSTDQNKTVVAECQTNVQTLSRSVGLYDSKLQDIINKQNSNPAPQNTGGTLLDCGEGLMTWRLENFSQIRRSAVNGDSLVVNSPSFYTAKCGYKLRLRLFPNGDGSSRGKAISLFVQVQRGDYDELLPWPMNAKVFFLLVDQAEFKNHIRESFQTKPDLAAFRRPKEDNPASGCQTFVSLERLSGHLGWYMPMDTLIIRVLVEVGQNVKDQLANLNPKPRRH